MKFFRHHSIACLYAHAVIFVFLFSYPVLANKKLCTFLQVRAENGSILNLKEKEFAYLKQHQVIVGDQHISVAPGAMFVVRAISQSQVLRAQQVVHAFTSLKIKSPLKLAPDQSPYIVGLPGVVQNRPGLVISNLAQGETYFMGQFAEARDTASLPLFKTGKGDISVDLIYQRFLEAGLAYGTIFQGLETIAKQGESGMVSGIIRGNFPTTKELPLHPAMLDAAFQLAMPLVQSSPDYDPEEGKIAVPAKFKYVEYRKPKQENSAVYYATAKLVSSNRAFIKYDLQIWNDADELVFLANEIMLGFIDPKVAWQGLAD